MIPTLVQAFFVPMFTLLIAVPLAFIVIGPLTTWAAELVGLVINYIYVLNHFIAGIVIGGTWPLLVMLGLHWGLILIGINNMMIMSYDSILVNMAGTPLATAGVVLGIAIRTKNKKLRDIAIPACISSVFGVSDPSIYGVTLLRKKPFYATLFSAAVGGAIMVLFGTKSYVIGGMGIFGIPHTIHPEYGFDRGFYGFLLTITVSFILRIAFE